MCFEKADILIARENRERFAVIACDQFTSEPEYWDKVKEFTNGYKTALDLILPEIYLKDDNSAAIAGIRKNMRDYLAGNVFEEIKDSFIYVRRVQSDGLIREGIIGRIDLKEYSYKGEKSGAVRATEKTVLERIPPRAEIRRGAPLEMPHIMLLFDDRENAVARVIEKNEQSLIPLYDFELFGGAGHIMGKRITGAVAEDIKKAFSAVSDKNNGLLFLVGDGNHSLAAAKSIYEETGQEKDRYALVEAVNIHSPAINFEPIYRVCFGVDPVKFISDFEKSGQCGEYEHEFTCVYKAGQKTVKIRSDYRLPVAELQDHLDNNAPDVRIDYIHGTDPVFKIAGGGDNSLGFIFKGMDKDELFGAVLKNGSLPRKTFSMGHALDKRFYFEARRIGLPD
ncbi:MAG: DUF1015 domain-containing protein [Clostridia bacterium]|nr:DUF1015 domain-containing protein [Clostridia bacterium]